MSKKTTSKHQKDLFKLYASSDRYAINRMRKLEKRVKMFPDDKAAADTLKKAKRNGISYRRKKPNNKVWSAPKKLFAHQLAESGYNGKLALLDNPFGKIINKK